VLCERERIAVGTGRHDLTGHGDHLCGREPELHRELRNAIARTGLGRIAGATSERIGVTGRSGIGNGQP
jgi:hypothetical protein